MKSCVRGLMQNAKQSPLDGKRNRPLDQLTPPGQGVQVEAPSHASGSELKAGS